MKRKKPKPEIWWCVKRRGDKGLISAIPRSTRADAVEWFMHGLSISWKQAYRKGFRVVKIKVEEV